MSDIVFMDTETLGVDIDSPIWEFAAVRRSEGLPDVELHMFIRHDRGTWLDTLPDEFANDYRTRYGATATVSRLAAAGLICNFVPKRAHIIGAVPNFDTERIAHQLLRPFGWPEPWHYHLIDIENVVVGWVRGHYAAAGKDMPILPPYDSNELSRAVGVDPEQFERHTAMGDVRWVMAQWDAVMGGAR